jgi:hypothetical protein
VTNLAPRAALVALALTLLAAAPAAAQTPSPIEGVWSFSGGQIAVDRQGDGFVGTVVRRTQLSECVHEVGEQIWIDIRLQGDGSYWGKHQYFRTSDCTPIERGNTAYRVLNPAGQTFLRVCFAKPETPDVQPRIAEDGSNTDTNDGCRDSELLRPLPTEEPKLKDIAKLPKETKGCASRRRFPIRLIEPPGDALESARITLNGKPLRVFRRAGRLRSVVDLRGLPRGRYAVKIVAETVRGQTIKGKRRYRTCGKKKRIGDVGRI